MNPEALADHINVMYGPPMTALSDCLRSFLIAAPGHDLIACDFANIEGRGLAWLAGEEWKIEAFRAYDTILGVDERGTEIRKGPDLYKVAYARSFEMDVGAVDKTQRQIGKVQELALGYQGGFGAFVSMAANYGVRLPEATVNAVVKGWRSAHPNIVQFWWDLEEAAVRAIGSRDSTTEAGAPGRKIRFKRAGSFLFCQLPSKRCIVYPYPKLRHVMVASKPGQFKRLEESSPEYRKAYESHGWKVWEKDEVSYMGTDAETKAWVEIDGYGGMFAENVTQAICRDLLAEAMKRLRRAGYPIVLHCHDEAVAEVPKGAGSLEEVESIMCELPPWAAGLPVTAKGWRGKRYRKD